MHSPTSSPASPLAWTIVTTEIPERGLRIERSATPEEREAVRAALSLLACDRLLLRCRIRAMGAGCYRLDGGLEADVAQECVVTLEPVSQRITAPLDVELQPPGLGGGESVADPFSEREIETFEHGVIDLGRIVFEEAASRLDPYPRLPGTEFDWQDPAAARDDDASAGADRAAAGPFAKLAALKARKP